MTPAQTILAGTSVACATYLLKQFLDFYFFRRIAEFDSIRGRAIESAIFISHFLLRLPSTPQEEVVKRWIEETQGVRKLAGAVIAFENKRHPLLWGIPSKRAIHDVTIALLGLSDCTRQADRENARKHAKTILTALKGGGYDAT